MAYTLPSDLVDRMRNRVLFAEPYAEGEDPSEHVLDYPYTTEEWAGTFGRRSPVDTAGTRDAVGRKQMSVSDDFKVIDRVLKSIANPVLRRLMYHQPINF